MKRIKAKITVLFILAFLAAPCLAQKQVVRRQSGARKNSHVTVARPQGNTAARKSTGFKARRITEAECRQIIDRIVSNMVLVNGGTFTMGSADPEPINKDEAPAHKVTLSSFYINKYEVTKLEWKAVMAGGGMTTEYDNNPQERVTRDDAMMFISTLNELTGRHFRLPTEAEWEFAARGGNMSHGYKYAGSNDRTEVAWDAYGKSYDDDLGYTHPVGQKKPNELGLYDMSGNVMEWTGDWYGPYSAEPQTNPKGPSAPNDRRQIVSRGGCWAWGRDNDVNSSSVTCRIPWSEDHSGNEVGFRLAMDAD